MGDAGKPDQPGGGQPRSSELPTELVIGGRQARDSQARQGTGSAQRYQIGSEIGRGGMGRVVEATDAALGRTVAVKEALATDWDSVRRFEREMKLTAELEHPGIVPIYDRGRGDNGRPFYVMRRLSGRPLSRLIAETTTLGDRLTLLPALLSAVDAVAYAHRKRILHRDLKPSNVLIGDLGEVSVIDWGLAKRLDAVDEPEPDELIDATHPGAVLGSPGFMAPEQALAEEVDQRTDVFALGACLYFLLSGTSPHGDGSAEDLLDRAERPARPLREVVEGVPPDLLAIVDKALAHDRDQRYPDAGALGAELRRFLSGQLVAAYHYTSLQRLRRFVQRHRVAVGATVAAIAIVAVVSAVAARRVIAERDQANRSRAAEEVARRQAEDRADVLVLNQAATRVNSNPAAAVGLLQYLSPESPRWDEARVVAAAAAARGVPWGHQVHRGVVIAVRSSPDRRTAASADRHGRLVLHDTAARTAREIALVPDALDFAWLGDDALIVYASEMLARVDIGSGKVRELATPAPINAVIGNRAGTVVIATCQDGTLMILRPGLDAPAQVPQPDGASGRIGAVSEDGNWAAREARDRIELLRLSDSAADAVIELADAKHVTFAPDSTRLSYTTFETLVEMELDGGNWVEVHRQNADAGIPVYAGNGLFHVSFMGAAVKAVTRSGLLPLAAARPNTIPSSAGECGGSLCMATNSGTVYIFHPAGEIELHTGARSLSRMDATSDAVVASSHGVVLAWPLDALLPSELRGREATLARLLSDRALIYGRDDDQLWKLWWQSLADGELTELGELEFMGRIGSRHDSRSVISFDPRDVLYWHQEGQKRQILIRDMSLAAWFEPERMLVSGKHGRVVELDLSKKELQVLAEHPQPVVVLDARGSWRMSVQADSVWRLNVATNNTETIDGSFHELALAADGSAYLASGDAISVWPVNQKARKLAELEAEVVSLTLGGAGLVATTVDNSLVRIDPTGEVEPEVVHARADDQPEVTESGEYAMVRSGKDVLVYEIAIGRAYARASNLQKRALSPDGRTVAAHRSGKLLLWRDPVPRGQAELKAWLAGATNAVVGSTGEVTWPAL